MTNSGKGRTVGLWVLRVLLAVAFLGAGGGKLTGAQAMIEVFQKIGIGQWFRIVTGLLEVTGSILLLIPRLTLYGVALLVVVLVGAVTAHLTVLGGSPFPALILLVLNAVTVWLSRGAWKKV